MPSFTNQATLTYGNYVAMSNVVTGNLAEVLTATKDAVTDSYREGCPVMYAINIVNSGSLAYNGLTVTDDLGGLTAGTAPALRRPLDYVAGSIRYYSNGVLQAAPTVAETDPLVVTGINVPAGGNALLLYTAMPNQFAPVNAGGRIANSVSVTGEGIVNPVTATAETPVDASPSLSIIKALNPTTVVENEPLTYTFTIQNTGATAVTAKDNVVVQDVFDPVLNMTGVALNGVPLTGTAYTYNRATGEFATAAGTMTVPAASYQRDPATGAWLVIPGVTVLTVTGTL